jgi:hypothetical protein
MLYLVRFNFIQGSKLHYLFSYYLRENDDVRSLIGTVGVCSQLHYLFSYYLRENDDIRGLIGTVGVC